MESYLASIPKEAYPIYGMAGMFGVNALLLRKATYQSGAILPSSGLILGLGFLFGAESIRKGDPKEGYRTATIISMVTGVFGVSRFLVAGRKAQKLYAISTLGVIFASSLVGQYSFKKWKKLVVDF